MKVITTNVSQTIRVGIPLSAAVWRILLWRWTFFLASSESSYFGFWKTMSTVSGTVTKKG